MPFLSDSKLLTWSNTSLSLSSVQIIKLSAKAFKMNWKSGYLCSIADHIGACFWSEIVANGSCFFPQLFPQGFDSRFFRDVCPFGRRVLRLLVPKNVLGYLQALGLAKQSYLQLRLRKNLFLALGFRSGVICNSWKNLFLSLGFPTRVICNSWKNLFLKLVPKRSHL